MLRNTFNSLCTKYRSRTWHWIQQRRQSGSAKSASNTVALPGYMRAKDLAKKLNTDVDSVTRYCKQRGHSCRKASELIVDYATAQSLARDRGITALYQELDISRRDYWSRDHNQATRARPLVVLVIGRVNSGKTTLLDLLRRRGGLQSQIAPYEPGLITQDYHAFTIEHGPHTPITWIDTPGHHVFHLMRQHGVSVADCALVLVDALSGVDDDTRHCLELARAHSVPVILAINKLDMASSQQIELVYAQLHARGFLSRHVTRDSNPFNQRELLQSHGNLEATEYLPAQDDDTDQGPVIVGVVEISAKTEANVDRLLHAFSEESHVLRECMKPMHERGDESEGTLLESMNSAQHGQNLHVLAHWGQFNLHQHVLAGFYLGKIKQIYVCDNHPRNSSSIASTPPLESSAHVNHFHALQFRAVERVEPGRAAWLVTTRLNSLVSADEYLLPPPGVGVFQRPKQLLEHVLEHRLLELTYHRRVQAGLAPAPQHRADTASAGQSVTPVKESAAAGSTKKKSPTTAKKKDAKKTKKRSVSVPPRLVSVIIKCDTFNRLEALTRACSELTALHNIQVRVLRASIGDVTPTDMFHAQVAIEASQEEGKEISAFPLYCFNVDVNPSVKGWLTKNPKMKEKIVIKRFNVFSDIVEDIKQSTELAPSD